MALYFGTADSTCKTDVRSFRRYTNRKNKIAAKRAFLKAAERLD
ncbi:hypothetical protein [Pseudanabaena yagii]|nr:hypothetical protein [Pseudanabaena yagii]